MSVHLGEYMAMMVATYLVYRGTHSVADTALVLVCFNVPALALAGAAAALSRRWGAPGVDAVLRAAESVLAVVPSLLAAEHHLGVVTLLAWVSCFGALEGLNSPNTLVIRHLIAAPGRLPELNSAYTRNVAVSAVVGLLLGGLIFQWAGASWVFVVLAISGLPEVAVFAGIARRVGRMRESRRGSGLTGALGVLRSEPGLWAAGRYAVLCFFVAGYAVTLPAIARAIGPGAELLALLESGSVLGGILVALVVRRVHGLVHWGAVQRACYTLAGLGLGAIAIAEAWGGIHSRPAAVVAFVATIPVGFGVLMNTSIVTSVVQIATPSEHRSSMFTLLALVPLLVGPLSQEIVGEVADHSSVGVALGALAGFTILVSAAVSHRPMGRHFDALNDAVDPFVVNELGAHRSALRGHLHEGHWPDPI